METGKSLALEGHELGSRLSERLQGAKLRVIDQDWPWREGGRQSGKRKKEVKSGKLYRLVLQRCV